MFYPQLSSEQFPCLEIYIMQSANLEEKRKKLIKSLFRKKKNLVIVPSIPENDDKLLIQNVSKY